MTTEATTAPAAPIVVTDAASKEARRKAGQAEAKLVDAWKQGGEKGPRPATPNLDAIDAEYKELGPSNKRTGTGKAKAPAANRQTVVFTVDGRPQLLKGRTYTLGYLAQRVLGAGSGVTDKLRKELSKAGVKDAEHTEWEAEVNGVKVGAVMAGSPKAKPQPKAAKPKAATKAPAKKAPAKKATAKRASKPRAKKATKAA